MDSPIYYFKKQLLQDKEEINFFLDLCKQYKKKDRHYYNLPLPDEIYEKYENGLDHNRYNNINNLNKYEEELEFYKWVAEEYDKNDFIITDFHFNRGLRNDDDILKFYICPDYKKIAHEICDEIETKINILKNKGKN